MLTVHDLCKRFGVSKSTIWQWRKQGIIPQPLVLGPQTVRWRLQDIRLHEQWLLRRSDLRAKGLDPDTAAEPDYSLPTATDAHQIGREVEASRDEPSPTDNSSDKEKLKAHIEHLRRKALQLCLDAGKEIPSELLQEAKP
ncbi:MAG TPA: hypothetical protein DHW22_02810 [Planctomycetaceae bacterium]|nr:hypothetical protein [Planctomycetaceae bacterium]|tara:strand:- start:2430 stop:2849 length:420 start_codon:yes stop_codon:yes gene_type:complete